MGVRPGPRQKLKPIGNGGGKRKKGSSFQSRRKGGPWLEWREKIAKKKEGSEEKTIFPLIVWKAFTCRRKSQVVFT